MRLPRAWFLPREEDVLGRLWTQAGTVHATVGVLAEWAHGEVPATAAVDQLRRLRSTERDQRRGLHGAVGDSFSTPLEPEDLLELAERLHELSDVVYVLVREAELSRMECDNCLVNVIEAVAAASRTIDDAIRKLPDSEAAALADRADEQLAAAEHGYRAAVADLEHEVDVRRELRRRELYRRAEHLTAAAARVAHRIWYAVSKSS